MILVCGPSRLGKFYCEFFLVVFSYDSRCLFIGPRVKIVKRFSDHCRMSAIEEGGERAPLISKEKEGKDSSTYGKTSTNSSASRSYGALSRRQRILNAICILMTELCERLTFYGASANLVLFSQSVLKLGSPWPSLITLLFQGTCYVTPLLGGWLSDTYLGQFNTIYGCCLWYLVGVILLAAVSITDDMLTTAFDTSARLVYFAIALVLIALCAGGIKANVAAFGADQLNQDGPRAVQTFYNWYYWFINTGSLLAITVVVGVQQIDIFSGYAINAVSIIFGLVALLARRNKYLVKPPVGSQLTEIAKITGNAIQNRKQNNGGWMDGAKSTFGGKFSHEKVEDVKAVLRVLPVFVTFILFFTVYFQISTSCLVQGAYMNLKLLDFTIPPTSSMVVTVVFVLVLTPLLEHAAYPYLERIGIKLTPLRRIGAGFLSSAVSMLTAGLVEIKRREVWLAGDICKQEVLGETRNASCLSVFWQSPQFMLIGTGEVLATIAGLEFAYSQAPEYLKGVIMGVFLAATGFGAFLANLLVGVVNDDWYPEKDPNQGHMEYYFFLLSGLMMLNFLLFLYIASSYKYKGSAEQGEEYEKEQDVLQLSVSTQSVRS
ncbi:solute carrier family 15 member 4-like isoform X1 [Stylophora pistillata]|nr:solute carrier family 15 member 4-like isoform X1 [Stylophora pistillata]